MKSAAKTVKEYLAALPADRRDALETVRDVILRKLPKGYEEKSCIRFKSVDELALDAIGKTVAMWSVKQYVTFAKAAREGRRT